MYLAYAILIFMIAVIIEIKGVAMNIYVRKLSAIRVVEFSNGGYKIRKIFARESTYPKEIIDF
jgi:hypothetical protein